MTSRTSKCTVEQIFIALSWHRGVTVRNIDREGGVIYVPTRSVRDGQVQMNLYRLPDGRLALPTYSSLTELISCCGSAQTWAAYDTQGVSELRRLTDIDVFLLDAKLPDELKQFGRPVSDEVESSAPRSWLQDPLGRESRKRR